MSTTVSRETPLSADGTSTLDVSGLPEFAFGHRDPLWWGVVLVFAIEGTVAALCFAMYFYVRGNEVVWPVSGAPGPWPTTHVGLPVFVLATMEAALLAASAYPMARTNRAAEAMRTKKARAWLVVTTVVGAAAMVVRFVVIDRLPFRWDSHGYGSVFWAILGLHTFHLITGVLENALFSALLFKGPVEKKHFPDLKLNGIYWYFTVVWWIPAYALLYFESFFLRR